MRTVIIGSGAVAEAFAAALRGRLTGVVARNGVRGREVAAKGATEYFAELPDADLYIIAVSDRAIGEVSRKYRFPHDSVVAHTSGCSSVDDLSTDIPNRAVIYPMQTFTAGRNVDFAKVPFFVEGSSPKAEKCVRELASELSDKVCLCGGEQRRKLHLAATFICNFANMMYIAGEDTAGVPFDTFEPLVRESVDKAFALTPRRSQTGVAVRGDREMQLRHEALLAEQHPEYLEMYKTITKTIWETLKKI